MTEKSRLPTVSREMVEEFQCPGCVCGSDTGCGKFDLYEGDGWVRCAGQVPGTSMVGVGSFYLGMPRGFNRVGMRSEAAYRRCDTHPDRSTNIRLFPSAEIRFFWDKFNIAVWAMEKGGYLFVRTYSPRINDAKIDVIKGGTMALVPGAIDVGEFVDEID